MLILVICLHFIFHHNMYNNIYKIISHSIGWKTWKTLSGTYSGKHFYGQISVKYPIYKQVNNFKS